MNDKKMEIIKKLVDKLNADETIARWMIKDTKESLETINDWINDPPITQISPEVKMSTIVACYKPLALYISFLTQEKIMSQSLSKTIEISHTLNQTRN